MIFNVVALVAVSAGVTIYSRSKDTYGLSDIALENVEALALNENWGFDCAAHGCYVDFSANCFYPAGLMWGYCPNMKSRGY